ncbi:hypothetical protein [Nocardioides campestrisoli]|uniref:hypothetical protein n=1 Tax=Nocardioides campestrisoli TaxID=2736757 RepID=UPI0015E71345|nr:hypothetical protein [Nocardioides campestrisoli]
MPARPPLVLSEESLGAWLLKTDPRGTSVADLLAGGLARVATRCVRRSYRTDLIAPGQPVLLWVSGGDRRHPAGLYAQGRTTGPATTDDEGQLVMPLALEALPEPVLRDELLEHPELSRAEVIRMPAGSNPSYLSGAQLDALRQTWPQVTFG